MRGHSHEKKHFGLLFSDLSLFVLVVVSGYADGRASPRDLPVSASSALGL